jgi:hypothetical protein
LASSRFLQSFVGPNSDRAATSFISTMVEPLNEV